MGFLVGHSTVRRVVMGDGFRRAANENEIGQMERMVDESLAAGALGFSSSLSDTHNDGDNEPVPSRFATEEEILRLCATLRSHAGTWLEFIPWVTGPFPEERAMLMAKMSVAAARPLNWSCSPCAPTWRTSTKTGLLPPISPPLMAAWSKLSPSRYR